jgi:hybrid cluster-associated redox disulfide protein
MKMPIRAEILSTPVAFILASYPQIVHVFIRNRMGCIGCAFSRFHTLEDVIEIYQLDEEKVMVEIQELLRSRDDLDPSTIEFEKA